ncbi:MAG: ABC transporter permease [Prevotellaceae bacterium]|nr:ABC transporter permease [Prevotellaceae bacterium]
MKTLDHLYNVISREIRIIFSYPIYLVCMFVLPCLCAAFFTTMMDSGQPMDMPVGVVDNDNTSMTRKLIRTLDSFQSSKVVAHYPSVDDARHAIQTGEIYGFMYFPKHTTDELLASRQPKISFYYSNTSLTAGALIFKDMKTMATLGSAAVGQATLQAKGYRQELIMPALQPIAVDLHMIGNPWVNYNIYLSTMLIPGCFLLFIFLMTPYSFGAELKFGKSRELMAAAGDNAFIAIIGKLIPHTLIYFIVMSGLLAYMFVYLHFPAPGGIWRIMLLGYLSIIGAQGFSLTIFGLIPALRMSMSICSLMGVLSFSMVGSAFPIFAMDAPLQALAWLFPLRHYYMIYQLCVFNTYPLADALPHILCLIGFAVMPYLLTMRIGKVLRHYDYIE